MAHVAPLVACTKPGRFRGTRWPPPRASRSSACSTTMPTRSSRHRHAAPEGLQRAFDEAGVPAIVPRVGPLLGVFFTERQPTNFDEAQLAADNGVYPRFFHAMLDEGVALAPGAYEALFPSLAHTDDVIDETIAAASRAVATLASP